MNFDKVDTDFLKREDYTPVSRKPMNSFVGVCQKGKYDGVIK